MHSTKSSELEDYRIKPLCSDDIVSVTELYQKVSGRAPYGYLASRDFHDFAEALTRPETTIAVGARYGEELVAYSLCRLTDSNPYASNPVLDKVFQNGGPIYQGMGTVVLPEHEGKLLMARMLNMRATLLNDRSAKNVIGLVAVGNLASMISILRAGGVFAGFQRDETSLNYVAIGTGKDSGIMPGEDIDTVAIDKLEDQSRLFDKGFIAHSIKRLSDNHRELIFCKPV